MSPPLSPSLPAPGLSGGTLAASGHAPRRSAGERGGPTYPMAREAWSLRQQGEPMWAVCARFGVCDHTLRSLWRRLGYNLPTSREIQVASLRNVLDALQVPMTSLEVADAIGLSHVQTQRRVAVLDRKGFIRAVGREPRRPNGGQRALIWSITDAGRAWLAGEP